MTIFLAFLLDAYRELNSRKLFWIILAISGLVVLRFASIGFNDTGMTMFFGLSSIEEPLLSRHSPVSSILYRGIFSHLLVGMWLSWGATILALFSTASIFPDFIRGGAVDIILAKPVSRARIFLYKYIASLLFVGMQVLFPCFLIFLALGFRLGDWEWKIFAAVPVVLLFFSYLFSICVLLGIRTRSPLAALIGTMVIWFTIFSLNASYGLTEIFRFEAELQIDREQQIIDENEEQIAAIESSAGQADAAAHSRSMDEIEDAGDEIERLEKGLARIMKWNRPLHIARTILPKTDATIDLLDRWLTTGNEINLWDIMGGTVRLDDASGDYVSGRTDQEGITRKEVQKRIREQDSAVLVIGSSLLFEAIILFFAGLIFVRRDY